MSRKAASAGRKSARAQARRANRKVQQAPQPRQYFATGPVRPLGDGSPAEQRYIDALISYYSNGQYRDALALGVSLEALHPADPVVHNLMGAVYSALNCNAEAVRSYQRAVELKPDYAHAYNNLGVALNALKMPQEAATNYLKALECNPNYAEAYNNLGFLLADAEEYETAIQQYTRAIQLKPNYPAAYYNLGNALKEAGRYDEAESSYFKAIEFLPNYAMAHNSLGILYRELGRRDDAVAQYETALRIQPDLAAVHYNLSSMKRFTADDPQIAQIEECLKQTQSDEDRRNFSFALAKAYDDIGDTDTAFAHYLEANRLRKQEVGYSAEADIERFSVIKRVFSSGGAPLAEVEPTGTRPIFIVGMPRSGTTLTEQILASHSQVHGAGELHILPKIVSPILSRLTKTLEAGIDVEIMRQVREAYASGLAKLETSKPVVTDKMPLNFRSIGFIFNAFSEAKLVHVRRDPVATCWSNFTNYFSSSGNGFAYDLTDLATFYNRYTDLMAFWHELFPGRIYDLDYEALTENQEEETRKLLDYCELPWEDACLTFHETDRAVRTASADQVRQKIYKGSSRSWRRYESHLEPLISALKA